MISTTSYQELHDRVTARPGAAERLAALRRDTLAEIGLYELRRSLERSQSDLAAELGISQPAVSQLERSDDMRLSTLGSYLNSLGARLQVLAIFDDGEAETVIPIKIGANFRRELLEAVSEADWDEARAGFGDPDLATE